MGSYRKLEELLTDFSREIRLTLHRWSTSDASWLARVEKTLDDALEHRSKTAQPTDSWAAVSGSYSRGFIDGRIAERRAAERNTAFDIRQVPTAIFVAEIERRYLSDTAPFNLDAKEKPR